MNIEIYGMLSRYSLPFISLLLFFCGQANGGVDDVWKATPATQDTQWAQTYAKPVNPSNSSSNGDIVGTRVARALNTTYTADSSGLVECVSNRKAIAEIYVDGVFIARVGRAAGEARGNDAFSFAVKRGSTYRCNSSGGTDVGWMYFVPLG